MFIVYLLQDISRRSNKDKRLGSDDNKDKGLGSDDKGDVRPCYKGRGNERNKGRGPRRRKKRTGTRQ